MEVKRFPNTGDDFSGLYAAQKWLTANGYVYGTTQRGAPIGVHRASETSGISKWRNLSQKERASLDGKLEAVNGSPREDDMLLTIGVRTDPLVAVERWGKDHWSTFGFVAYWCMEDGGVFGITTKAANMRTDPSIHPEFSRLVLSPGIATYPTRLKDGEIERHDDWSCLEDMERAGFIEIGGTGVHPEVTMTDRGLEISGQLNAHKTRGGNFHSFQPVLS